MITNFLNTAFLNFDSVILEFAQNLHHTFLGPFFDKFFLFITYLGEYGLFLILLSALLIAYKKTRKVGFSMLLGLFIGYIITNVCLKPIIIRPRPYADSSGIFYKWWTIMGSHSESGFSFPSGHTTAAFATMSGMFFASKNKYCIFGFIFAILMGFSRVYLVVHYPTDVFAAAIVGVFSGFVACLLIKYFYYKFDRKNIYKIIRKNS